jgi:FkbM family methyltransferase
MICATKEEDVSEKRDGAVLDRVLAWLTANPRVTRRLIPWVRAYVRYVPLSAGKRSFWMRVVDPYFAWTSHDFVAATRFGCQIAGNTRDIIGQYIYYFGVWEPHLTRWISQRLAPGDTFIDVGANVGYYSLLASRLVGESGTVVAIEASPRIFRALKDNLVRNRVQNVRAVNVAVSDRQGVSRLFQGPDSNCGLTTIVEEESSKNDCQFECEVNTAPLSDLLTPQDIQHARLIKIDVEGAEWPVVVGLAPLLHCGRPDLEVVVEVSPQRLAHHGKRSEDLLKVFQEAGFQAYRLENDYSAASYLAPQIEKVPERIENPIEQETDILFSRMS